MNHFTNVCREYYNQSQNTLPTMNVVDIGPIVCICILVSI